MAPSLFVGCRYQTHYYHTGIQNTKSAQIKCLWHYLRPSTIQYLLKISVTIARVKRTNTSTQLQSHRETEVGLDLKVLEKGRKQRMKVVQLNHVNGCIWKKIIGNNWISKWKTAAITENHHAIWKPPCINSEMTPTLGMLGSTHTHTHTHTDAHTYAHIYHYYIDISITLQLRICTNCMRVSGSFLTNSYYSLNGRLDEVE